MIYWHMLVRGPLYLAGRSLYSLEYNHLIYFGLALTIVIKSRSKVERCHVKASLCQWGPAASTGSTSSEVYPKDTLFNNSWAEQWQSVEPSRLHRFHAPPPLSSTLKVNTSHQRVSIYNSLCSLQDHLRQIQIIHAIGGLHLFTKSAHCEHRALRLWWARSIYVYVLSYTS